jgi:hypothetical protein
MRGVLVALATMALSGCVKAAPPEPLAFVIGPFTPPCLDCPETVIELTRKGAGWAEGTYRLVETPPFGGASTTRTGDWTTLRGDAADEDAVVYELDPDQPDRARHFRKVGETSVKLLDRDLKQVPEAPLIPVRARP